MFIKLNKKICLMYALLLVATLQASQTLREAYHQTLTETDVLYNYGEIQHCYQGPSTPQQCDPVGMRESMQFHAGSLSVSTVAASLVAQEQNTQKLKELGLHNNSNVQLKKAPTITTKPTSTPITLQKKHQQRCQELERELGL